MKQGAGVGIWLLVLAAPIWSAVNGWAGPRFKQIPFDDLIEGIPLLPRESWNSVGMDPFDNVYAVFGGPTTDRDSEDCALFQYNAKTGRKRLLGTVSDAMKAAGNFREDERIPKGHCNLVYMNGKVYFGVQNFHDANGDPSRNGRNSIQAALATRGAHLLAYNLETDQIEDLSAREPDGVFFPGRGIIALAAVPNTDLLACQTIPHGDIMFYDTKKSEVTAKVPGVEKELGMWVGRDIIASPNGRVFQAYLPESLLLPGNDDRGAAYVIDASTFVRQEEPIAANLNKSLWNGSAISKDYRKVYLVTQSGILSRLDWENSTIEELGSILPEDERAEADYEGVSLSASRIFGMAMSADERYLYAITVRRGPRGGGQSERTGVPARSRRGGMFGLLRYDLATGEAKRSAMIPEEMRAGWALGSNLVDSEGSIYFQYHSMQPGDDFGLIHIGLDGE